jgi:hypothetical protein
VAGIQGGDLVAPPCFFKEQNMREKALGILLLLFMACFIAVIVEETFLGGRRKRKLLRDAKDKRNPLTD